MSAELQVQENEEALALKKKEEGRMREKEPVMYRCSGAL